MAQQSLYFSSVLVPILTKYSPKYRMLSKDTHFNLWMALTCDDTHMPEGEQGQQGEQCQQCQQCQQCEHHQQLQNCKELQKCLRVQLQRLVHLTK